MVIMFFFFKQKTAYEMRISDWSSDVCSSDLKENVRLVSPYIGGGFGGKLFIRSDALLAALGAKAAGRPVKLALQRPLMINNTTHRPATIQRIRLGATNDGKLTAIGHESWRSEASRVGKARGGTCRSRWSPSH